MMRACADDIGAVLRNIATLKVMAHTFSLAIAAAGLDLKPKKCVITPIVVPVYPAVKHMIKLWLLGNLPGWIF